MDFIQYISKFSALQNTSGSGGGGFICIDISSCYQNLAALMLIFTFLSTLLKYMVVAALCCSTHTNGRLPLKLHTTVKVGVTNLEKKHFTVSVYSRNSTGRVRVKSYQRVHLLFNLLFFFFAIEFTNFQNNEFESHVIKGKINRVAK